MSTQLYVHAAGNELLNYLKGLEADAVKSLTVVSEDGVEAMNTFIHRLLGTVISHKFMVKLPLPPLTPISTKFVEALVVLASHGILTGNRHINSLVLRCLGWC